MRCEFFRKRIPACGFSSMTTQEMLRELRDGKLHVTLLIQLSVKVLTELVFEELHRFAVCVADDVLDEKGFP